MVNVFKDGTTCPECEKANWIKSFQRYCKDIILSVDGKVKINYEKYDQAIRMHRDVDIKHIIHGALLDLGFLSLNSTGNWNIMSDCFLGLNPKAGMLYLYFTKKEYATEFARYELSGTRYGWEIQHISETINKEDILGYQAE
jgi:hypothetical protein